MHFPTLSAIAVAAATIFPQLASSCIVFQAEIDDYWEPGNDRLAYFKLIENKQTKCNFWDRPQPWKKNTGVVEADCGNGVKVKFSAGGLWVKYITADNRGEINLGKNDHNVIVKDRGQNKNKGASQVRHVGLKRGCPKPCKFGKVHC